jgi:BlaI family penicillinase repressor
MPREPQDVTEAELAILQALWKQPRASIRQLTDALHPGGDASEYATVKKQLERMEAKGLVERDRSLFVHLFSAAVDRQELVGRRLRQLADKLCEGSFAPIVSFLGNAKPLSAEERRALRELIEAPQPPSKGKRPRKE